MLRFLAPSAGDTGHRQVQRGLVLVRPGDLMTVPAASLVAFPAAYHDGG